MAKAETQRRRRYKYGISKKPHLTSEQHILIVEARKGGRKLRDIANDYGVYAETIRRICQKK